MPGYRELMFGFVDPQAEIDPRKPAVLIGDLSLSYGELDRRSAALAHVMVEHGVRTDDPVAVMLPNGFEIIEAGIATSKAGAAFLPVNWHLGPDEVGWILSDSGTRLLISHAEHGRDRTKGARSGTRLRARARGRRFARRVRGPRLEGSRRGSRRRGAREPLLPVLHVGHHRPAAGRGARRRGRRPHRRVDEAGSEDVGDRRLRMSSWRPGRSTTPPARTRS